MFETESAVCDLCGADRAALFFSRVDGEVESRVVRCGACGLLYTNPRLKGPGLVELYRDTYVENPGDRKKNAGAARGFLLKHPALRSWWHALAGQCLSRFLAKARGDLLDVGCGTGDLLDEAAARGCKVRGVEFNPDAVRRCVERGLDVVCGDMESGRFSPASFDTIVFWHSLEHLPSARGTLENAAKLLKPGGRVFIYLPNAQSYIARWAGPAWYGWQLPFHFFHFTPSTLRRLAEAAGYEVAGLSTVTTEYLLGHTLHRALGPRRIFGSVFFRAAAIPAIRLLDLLMPSGGEFLFAELSLKS